VVLDIGAHVGFFTIPIAQRAAQVHAFEPNPESAHYLHINVEQNGLLSKVVEHPIALGSQEQKVDMEDIRRRLLCASPEAASQLNAVA
jgi:FkbM family methyltransferase